MLRRDRQIRMQIHQLLDACLFAVSFPLAYIVRADENVTDLLGLKPWGVPLDSYVWVSLFLIPAAPFILEAQGFYNRPVVCPRRTTAWQLFKGCLFMALGLILALFFFQTTIPRAIVVWFAIISFILVFIKEEL